MRFAEMPLACVQWVFHGEVCNRVGTLRTVSPSAALATWLPTMRRCCIILFSCQEAA